jgi:hypothetical protein
MSPEPGAANQPSSASAALASKVFSRSTQAVTMPGFSDAKI